MYAFLYTVSRFYDFDEYNLSGSLVRKCIAQVIVEMHSGFREFGPSTESLEITGSLWTRLPSLEHRACWQLHYLLYVSVRVCRGVRDGILKPLS